MNPVLPGQSQIETLPRWDHSGRSLTVSSFKEALSLGQAKRFTAVEWFIIPQPAKCYCGGAQRQWRTGPGTEGQSLGPSGLHSTNLQGPAWPG